MSRLVGLIAVVALLASPATVAAQSNPLMQDPSQAPQRAPGLRDGPPPPASVDDTRKGDGLSGATAVLLGLLVLTVVGGIGWSIVRDARQAAPRRGPARRPRGAGEVDRTTPGARGRHGARPGAGRRGRRSGRRERRRRRRGRAR